MQYAEISLLNNTEYIHCACVRQL